MKQPCLAIIFLLVVFACAAQGVGIGTSTPNATAALDIVSNNRGLLIPRMTSSQRTAIPSPANGLMVFDILTHRLYQYQNGEWKYMIDDNYWTINAGNIYNTGLRVGINTTTPSESLEVNGNTRIEGNIVANGSITTGSTLSAVGISNNGNLLMNGTATINGSINTNSSVIINDAAGILELRASSVEKGFVQLSGDNIRVGTFASNPAGRFIVRIGGTDRMVVTPSGRVGIGTSNPFEELEVNGSIRFSGTLTTATTGASPLTPLCWGATNSPAAGGIRRGTANVSVVRTALGSYQLNCTGITSNSVVIIYSQFDIMSSWVYDNSGQISVYLFIDNDPATPGVNYYDGVFSFIIY